MDTKMDNGSVSSCHSSPPQDASSSNSQPSPSSPATTTEHDPTPAVPQQQPKSGPTDPPVKVRKKPGRKPNPASPALRKAQNRAAQRAFRERKERHLRELETTIKQVRQERDQLAGENEHLKHDNDTLRSENWYLKGIVLSLQLVCLQHNLTIPQHGPHINDQTLAVLAQSIPEPIASYIDVSTKSKIPTFDKTTGPNKHHRPARDRYVSSSTILLTKEGAQTTPCRRSSTAEANLPDLTTVEPDDLEPSSSTSSYPAPPPPPPPPPPRPVMLSDEPLTSNLAAIQTLRMRLRLQAACVKMNALPFAIQPTLLQLTIPHDPRIDLIPTSSMRDRMILFRDQFSLDDCFRCLLSGSVFHGGDPAIAGNWQLPPEFFEKYWFLTIDFSLHRMTNQWRRMQGLQEVPTEPARYATLTTPAELSSFLGIEFPNILSSSNMDIDPVASAEHEQQNATSSYPASLTSTASSSKTATDQGQHEMFSGIPIQLTDGCYPPKPHSLQQQQQQQQQQHHPFFTRRWDTCFHDTTSSTTSPPILPH